MSEHTELPDVLRLLKEASLQPDGSHRKGYASSPMVGYGEESPEGYGHPRQYWQTIRKRLWLILLIVVIACTLAAIRQARQPDIYQARARVQVDTESYSPALGASRGSSVYFDNNSFMDPEYFNTQVQILSSPTLLRRVARTLDLEHNQNFLNPPIENRSTWQNLLRMIGIGEAARTSTLRDKNLLLAENLRSGPLTAVSVDTEDAQEIDRLAPYVDSLQGMLEVEQVRKTRLIDIRASHTDPSVAAKVVNATADAFALWNLEVKTKTNSVAGVYLQRRIAELQSQIRNGEEQLVNYAQRHEILSLDASQNTVVERLAGLNRQLLEAENDRKLAEAAYSANLAPGAADAAAETSDRQISDLKSHLAELKQRLTQLKLTDTEESPEFKDVRQQIAGLEKTLSDARAGSKDILMANLETNYRKTLDREKALRASFNQQRSETVTQNQAAINYNILKQEIETNKGLLDGLMQRSKENDVSMAGTPNNIHVVDYSAVPKGPVGPQRLRGVMLALLLAIALGVVLALLLEYLDDTIKSPGDAESRLGLPSLAVIPIASRTATQRFLPLTRAFRRTNGNGTGRELLMNSGGPSWQAEAYKHLRTSVLLTRPGPAPKTLLVTSSLPEEGKTTTVVNTATVLAQTGSKVAVIDADMRRPRLHQVFGMRSNQGLSSILSGEATETEILRMIDRYEDTNVYLLPSGPVPANPAELLGSERMRRLLQVASAAFDYVVIDSPPIASFTDGVLLSSIVDGVLLVVHGGKTSHHVVQRTRQILQEIGAKIIGVVLNKIDIRSHQDYYYYYQGNYGDHYHKSDNGAQVKANGSLSIVSKQERRAKS